MANTKILIVDDDTNICELLRLYVEKEGYDVALAYDGGKALEAFEKEQPDLVLLDIMLPVLEDVYKRQSPHRGASGRCTRWT